MAPPIDDRGAGRRNRAPAAPIAILAAMDLELAAVLAAVVDVHAERALNRTFHRGSLHGREVVAAVAGIGKTAVAATATLAIDRYGAQSVVLIGLAGALAPVLAVGDVVVAGELIHHDLDASPIFPRYEVPSLGVARLPTDAGLSDLAHAAARRFLAEEYGHGPRAVRGLVLSGDQFIKPDQIAELRARFPDALAVEMEGAAVAQVCAEAQVPCAIVRSISDDGDAASFQRFLQEDCSRHAAGIIERLLGLC